MNETYIDFYNWNTQRSALTLVCKFKFTTFEHFHNWFINMVSMSDDIQRCLQYKQPYYVIANGNRFIGFIQLEKGYTEIKNTLSDVEATRLKTLIPDCRDYFDILAPTIEDMGE